jgi:hypothetical protein
VLGEGVSDGVSVGDCKYPGLVVVVTNAISIGLNVSALVPETLKPNTELLPVLKVLYPMIQARIINITSAMPASSINIFLLIVNGFIGLIKDIFSSD